MVIRRQLHLPFDLLFGASQTRKQSAFNYMQDLMDHLHHNHQQAHHHLKVVSARIKTHYNCLILWDSGKKIKNGFNA
jgi:hypothetical protein